MVSFEDLPSIALIYICEYLDRDHATSLVAFARASKHYYSIAITLLFRTIRFSTSSHLAAQAQQWYDTLQRSAATGCVRRLIIGGAWPKTESGILDQRRLLKISAGDHGYERRVTDEVLWFHTPADDKPATAVYEANEKWKPVAALVKQLLALQDLIYQYPSQFPPCLLETLHQYLPHCRLHIDPFKLRSLNDLLTDPYEIVLATSPCLYSIGVDCDMQYGAVTGEVQNFNYEAVQSMVAGLAPSLREIRVFHAGYGATFEGFPDGEPWKGFIPSHQTQSSSARIGALRSLWIRVGDVLIGTQLIRTWKAHTDFSVLKSLNLESEIAPDTLEYLAASSSFPLLRELVLVLTNDRMNRSQKSEFYDIASRFLLSLPPLSKLTLTGELSRFNMESLLEHHGAAVRSLYLRSPEGDKRLSAEQIAKIGQHCSLLEDLTLTVRRSKGDAAEVSTYQALGSFGKLKYLSLNLDASNHAILGEESLAGFDEEDDDADYPETATDSSFDEFEQRFFQDTYVAYRAPRNGHIRDAFINSAVDGKLAEAIFWTISHGKAVGSLPLEELRLDVHGGGNFGGGIRPESVSVVVAEVGRPWICKRCQRDDRRQELSTRELAQREQGTRQAQLPPFTEVIFRRIWPAGDGDWRDEWRSLSLQTLGI